MHIGSPMNGASRLDKPADEEIGSEPNRREHVRQNAMTFGDLLEMIRVERTAFHPKSLVQKHDNTPLALCVDHYPHHHDNQFTISSSSIDQPCPNVHESSTRASDNRIPSEESVIVLSSIKRHLFSCKTNKLSEPDNESEMSPRCISKIHDAMAPPCVTTRMPRFSFDSDDYEESSSLEYSSDDDSII